MNYLESISGAAEAAIPKAERIDDTPEVLWHYTSAAAFKSIISTHSVWMSDPLFMNDGSELRYGTELMLAELAKLPQSYGDEVRAHIRLAIEGVTTLIRPAVFCLCDGENLLNQWRDYGHSSSVRYSIGFDTGEFMDGRWNSGGVFVKLVYDEAVQRRAVRALFSKLFSQRRWRAYRELSPENRRAADIEVNVQLRWLSLYLKHPGYAAEREWRHLTHIFDKVPREWHTSPLGVVPHYAKTRLDGVPTRLPIRKVWVGPTPYADVAAKATREFLKDHGYECEVEASEIPERHSG